jgi:PhnB protein
MAIKPIPDGYHTVTPYLLVQGVPGLLDFVARAFDAREVHRATQPDGTVNHAEVRIGDSVVMMGEARGEFTPMPAMLYLYVADVDATYAQALRAGGASLQAPADQHYGDRTGAVRDPAGNQWWIATRVREVPHG